MKADIKKALVLLHTKAPKFNAWQCPTLTWGDPTLPSAIRRFTSEFEMGSGGTNALWSPGKLVELTEITFSKFEFWIVTRYTSIDLSCQELILGLQLYSITTQFA